MAESYDERHNLIQCLFFAFNVGEEHQERICEQMFTDNELHDMSDEQFDILLESIGEAINEIEQY